MLLAAVITSISTWIVKFNQGAVHPHRSACDVVITRAYIIRKMDNVPGSCARRDGTVGISKV